LHGLARKERDVNEEDVAFALVFVACIGILIVLMRACSQVNLEILGL